MGPISSDQLTDSSVMKVPFDTENQIYKELTTTAINGYEAG